jgi:TRAP-type C4-dicarboxylate transport system substrate-binding protein
MIPIHRRGARATATLAVAALLVGCGAASGTDKAGGDTVMLRLATVDGEVASGYQNQGPQAFVDNLTAVSGGRLKVEVATTYAEGAADAESHLVKAIAAGELDGGWPATRAFANGGITGLEVVEAPMTITSYAAERALVSGPVAGELLARLDGTGIVGLGLAVGPLRRPFAAKAPLLAPEDWAGIPFRTYGSPVQHDVVAALGATPVDSGQYWVDELLAGRLRGAEFNIGQYAFNGLTTEAPNVTANVVLWPKVQVLSLSRQRFDALSEEQQGWVREAARRAVQASVDAPHDESGPAQDLCRRGVRFHSATPEQLTAVRDRVRPVLDRFAADPLLGQIQAVAAAHPGPQLPDVPPDCQAGAAPAAGSDLGPIPSEVSSLPDGVYRVEVTRAELAAAEADESLADHAGNWTLTVRDGTYEIGCRPIANPGEDCGQGVSDKPFEAGDLRGTGNTVYFVGDPERLSRLTGCLLPPSPRLPDHCGPPDPYRLTWTLNGDALTFTEFAGMPAPLYNMILKPWRKIA